MAVTRNRVFETKVGSDTTWGKDYQVYLFDNGQGTCECPDWHNRGAVRGDFDYRCKHIIRAETSYRASLPVTRTVTQIPQKYDTKLGNRVVTVFADQNDNLYLTAASTTSAWGSVAAKVSETEVYEAFAQARQKLAQDRVSRRQ